MAGQFTKKQAESYWNRYNKDGNDVLTVDEVKQCIKDAFGFVDNEDVEEKFAFFGQKEVRDLTKDQFMEGMVMADKCCELKAAFTKMDVDKSGTLSMAELKQGLLEKKLLPEEHVETLMDELQYDNDGQYDIKEFIETFRFSQFCKQTYGF